MGVATRPFNYKPASQYDIPPPNYKAAAEAVAHTGLNSPTTTSTSMSQGFHQGIFSFSDGFVDRSVSQEQQQQQHVAQQSRRDKLRVQGFDGVPGQHHPLVPIEEEGGADVGIYEPSGVGEPGGNMLSDMFNFAGAGPTATDLLASQISGAGGYRFPMQRPGGMVGFSGELYGAGRQGMLVGGTSNLGPISGESPTSKHHLDGSQQQHQVAGLNAESAAAMQLFLMNPPPQAEPQPRSPSRAPPAALHPQALVQSFGEAPFAGGMVEGRGLSLSLSSSLQPFEMDKSQELRVREGLLYFSNLQQEQQPQQQPPPPPSQQQIHMGYGAMGVVNVLRNSKYSRAAQELLEEFCSVGRGQMKGNKMAKRGSSNPNPNASSGTTGAGASTSSSAKDATPLSPADRFEHQRKKTKLISMLDEVDRRYNHYCDQMQMVVNSFDTVMGFGAATPYTALAQKAMSRHFRCLKDAIVAQLKQTCELLGDKEGTSSSGITKGETPRLRLLDQSLRQQRAFHQMGMMEQEAWRPQRGLPERSVNILRAWLFEHFLHPYPSDADKHLLARQTGLSRNQVSNWFINARVRLWKPMVEDMYQQEFKDGEEGEKSEASHQTTSQSPTQQQQQLQQDQITQLTNVSSEAEPSPSSSSISRHHHRFNFSSDSAPALPHHNRGGSDSVFMGVDALSSHVGPAAEDMYRFGAAAAAAAAALGPSARMRFGTAAGDVSLTLGLRHGAGGNAPESSRSSSLRDFGG